MSRAAATTPARVRCDAPNILRILRMVTICFQARLTLLRLVMLTQSRESPGTSPTDKFAVSESNPYIQTLDLSQTQSTVRVCAKMAKTLPDLFSTGQQVRMYTKSSPPLADHP
jgi:hypothetical protein